MPTDKEVIEWIEREIQLSKRALNVLVDWRPVATPDESHPILTQILELVKEATREPDSVYFSVTIRRAVGDDRLIHHILDIGNWWRAMEIVESQEKNGYYCEVAQSETRKTRTVVYRSGQDGN